MLIERPPTSPYSSNHVADYLNQLILWLDKLYALVEGRLQERKISRRFAVSYSATINDNCIVITDTSVPRTVSIASAAIAMIDYEIEISDESGGAAVNNITVATEGAELINGAATYVITTNYGYVNLRSNGSNLFVR